MTKLKLPLLAAIICLSTLHLYASAFDKPVNHTKTVAGDDQSSSLCPEELLSFAQTLLGTHYHFASSNPLYGFDCSGFVSYVFKNFNIPVPRSSCEFISYGEKILLQDAKPGDVILFTGTNKRSRKIGHIGIIVSNQNNETTFIHSTSGKEHAVTITAMDKKYRRRFVQIIRLLKQNDAA